jgi:hypothetical protein
MSVIIKLLSKFDDSGLRKAKSGFSGLSKTLGAVGIGFGLSAITDTLMDAAKAAAADAKSTKLLNIQLERNAGATASSLKENDKFIESLSLQTGIMDDDLRPAMARFGNITGNVKDAQKLLKITLDAAAGSGRSQEKISKAVGQAYAGNTKALQRMFPELNKSKDVLGDFAKTYEGLAVANADPFMKFNNSMDILKEKLGVIVLPLIIDAIDTISKPGGLIETVGKFFEDVANPKTDAGKTFLDIKAAVGQVIDSVKEFFGFFGDGDAVKGFTNIAKGLIDALPALLALKGIMMLASGGKAIASLVTAITMIKGGTPPGGIPPAAGLATNPLVIASAASAAATYASSQLAQGTLDAGLQAKGMNVNITAATFTGAMALPYDASNPFILGGKRAVPNAPTNNVVINVQGADPKATVDAVSAYLKQNGSLPFIGKAGR